MASLIGQKLGQYEVIELLGQGGMATVYKAHQESIGRYVAIKVLPPHAALDDQFIERFQLEAKTIGSLQHPHILSLYDYGTQDDILYLVMAYVDGGSLEDIIFKGEPLPIKKAEKILRQIASALDYAHRKGVIHRDIKPANILLDTEGNALLADFGIVKMMGNDTNLTGTGVVGTPAYISPEQGQGELNIDGRADIYSLACVAFQLLTGYQPYRADSMMKVVLAHITEPVPNIQEIAPELPEALNHVIAKAMAKSPEERYPTAIEFAEAVSHAIHHSEESLASIRAQIPMKPTGTPTVQFNDEQPGTMVNAPTGANDSSSTIVVKQDTNLILIMGMFALMALVIVIVAIVLIGQQNQNTAIATNVTQETEVIEQETTIATPAPSILSTDVRTYGEMRYNSTNALGDTINLQVEDFKQPTDGNRYVVWLKNTESEDVINIGEIVIDATGQGILIYTDEDGRMLSGIYNSIAITEESDPDIAQPEGSVVYGGEVPIELTNALNEIFISSPDGFNEEGLLAGALAEADTGQTHISAAANARSIGSMKTHSEHAINILRGTNDDHDNSGSPQNPGRGVGVYFFIDKIDQLLLDVIQSEGTSIYVQQNAENIFVCTTNVRDWSDQVIENAFEMIAAESQDAVSTQATTASGLAVAITEGIDVNENGQVEAFEGECGLNQIPNFGIQVGNIDITEIEN